MGGGQNSAPPSDVAPGGGTYPVSAFGEAYNPDWGSSNIYSGIFKGLGQLGEGIASGGQYQAPQTQQITQSPGTGQPLTPVTQIPTTGGNSDLIALLQRLGINL